MKNIILLFFLNFYFSGFSQESDSLKWNDYTWGDDTVAIYLASEVDTAWRTDFILWFMQKGVYVDSCSDSALFFTVMDWIETPYKYAGSGYSGVDCSSLVKSCYSRAYHIRLTGSSQDLYNQCISVEKENLIAGDLVFFKIHKKNISHVGLYLGNGKFVHASVSRGVTISDLTENYYTKNYFSGGRYLSSEH